MKLLKIILLLIATGLAMPAIAQDKNAGKAAMSGTTDMEILREKIKADKKLVVAANMELTDAEAKSFWPIYDAYQKDLQKINERMGKVIKDYAAVWNKGAVPNEKARQLLDESFAIEEAELKLKRSYVPKLEKALPGIKVARYIQIENKIRALVRMELAANIPLVQ
jgi:hypothetical protein